MVPPAAMNRSDDDDDPPVPAVLVVVLLDALDVVFVVVDSGRAVVKAVARPAANRVTTTARTTKI